MKFTCEISPDAAYDEVIIRCRSRSDKIRLLESAIENALAGDSELVLFIRDSEYYVPKGDILFFETDDGKVKAHTSDRIYTSEHKLFELEEMMPRYFVRVSKSCIVNVKKIESITRNPLGASEVRLRGCEKKVYASRSYYKILKDKINEVRLKK
ncbi:MAG: LytTR family transcriptional regulator [Clostridia bacterium]|nr:LytTR family transcriptional regulator [Clostridia bacterium]